MLRKKAKNKEMLFSNPIIITVTAETFLKLDEFRATSNCQSIGEVARNILTRERILMLHKDISIHGQRKNLRPFGKS